MACGGVAALVLTLGGPDRLLPVGRAPGTTEQVQDNGKGGGTFLFFKISSLVLVYCVSFTC